MYGDINGDGFEDALVTLAQTGQMENTERTYVWLWDPATNAPRLLPDTPVVENLRCGYTISGFKVTDAGEVVVAGYEAGPSDACADPRRIPFEQTWVYDSAADGMAARP